MTNKLPTLTQLILIALVVTQVPTFWHKVTKYPSFEHANQACEDWEYSGDHELRSCSIVGTQRGSGAVVGKEGAAPKAARYPVKAFQF